MGVGLPQVALDQAQGAHDQVIQLDTAASSLNRRGGSWGGDRCRAVQMRADARHQRLDAGTLTEVENVGLAGVAHRIVSSSLSLLVTATRQACAAGHSVPCL